MRWVDETVEAVHDTVGEVFPDQVLGVAAVDGDEVACSVRPVDHESRCFEVGSIGKTFTATLLALAVVDGRASLDDPVSRWLDAGSNGDITLEQLATHTSGLPRLAPNAHDPAHYDPEDPYRNYTATLAEEALREVERTDIGIVVYSNFGFQLLGLVAERQFERPLADLVRAELFEPLGMIDSGVTGRSADPVVGHDARGAVTSAWNIPLPGPGGYESTVADMARYARAVLDPPAGRLGDAVRLAQEPRVDDGAGGSHCLAWHRRSDGLVWHNGGTGGFSSALVVAPATDRGVIGLINSADRGVLDDAVMVAAAGGDPRPLKLEPAGDEHHADALAVADLVIAHDYEGVRQRCDTQLGELLTDETMAGVFGPPGEPEEQVRGRSVRHAHKRGSAVVVAVDVDHETGEFTLELSFDEAGSLVGLMAR